MNAWKSLAHSHSCYIQRIQGNSKFNLFSIIYNLTTTHLPYLLPRKTYFKFALNTKIILQYMSFLWTILLISSLAKLNNERNCHLNGVIVITHMTYKGFAFSTKKVVSNSINHCKGTQYSAHQRYAVAQKAILTISNIIRIMTLHAAVHGLNMTGSSLWPLGMECAASKGLTTHLKSNLVLPLLTISSEQLCLGNVSMKCIYRYFQPTFSILHFKTERRFPCENQYIVAVHSSDSETNMH